ncbi:MAG TPA: N-acetyltransferase [Ignisphaera aggregans]|uniref:N-acetyltransferase n=1 Tax=Ignisphaera aggregans TaxID=334771 RepID=A0A832YX82_9CREN|nr:N-acetyltransferase [Ignisphaera aggregans]
MMSLESYYGGDRVVDSQVAQLYNKCGSEEPWAHRTLEAKDIENLFRLSWFSSSLFAVLRLDRRVVGFIRVWMGRSSCEVWLCVDPDLPEVLRVEAVEKMLSWASARCRELGTPQLSIWSGYRFSYMHRAIRSVLTWYVEDVGSMLMRFSGKVVDVEPPPNYRFSVLDSVDTEVLRSVVEVYNQAFSIYDWFSPKSFEDILTEFSWLRPIYIVALREGEVVGYAMLNTFRAIDGEISAEVVELAVKPRYRGRGIGKALLHYATLYAVDRLGVRDRLFLLAVPELIKFYYSMGYTPWREYMVIRTLLTSLPA